MLATSMVVSCKKKKDPDPAPTPEPPPKIISVKADGVEKSCTSACYSGSKSGNIRGTYFYLNGPDESIYLSCVTLPGTGTTTLAKNKDPLLIYIKNNVYYKAVSGSLNVTAIDTSAKGVINRLEATFNFRTDTSLAGAFFTITEGAVNLK